MGEVKMQINGDQLWFDSGRKCYTNNGVIGINPDLEVFEGYDGTLDYPANRLTVDEEIELADFMIARWQRFRESSALCKRIQLTYPAKD